VRLEDLQTDARIRGITAQGVATVVSVEWSGNHAVNVVYRDSAGKLADRLLFRDDECTLELDAGGRPWSFDGSGDLLRLVSEAYRFRLAWLFDPYVAISTSAIEPLPHQISAVYEEMMPRLPLPPGIGTQAAVMTNNPGYAPGSFTDVLQFVGGATRVQE